MPIISRTSCRSTAGLFDRVITVHVVKPRARLIDARLRLRLHCATAGLAMSLNRTGRLPVTTITEDERRGDCIGLNEENGWLFRSEVEKASRWLANVVHPSVW
jgi:hypothetical protein